MKSPFQFIQIRCVFVLVHVALSLNVAAKRFHRFCQLFPSNTVCVRFNHRRDILQRIVLVQIGQSDEAMTMGRSFSLEFVGEDHAGCDASATSNQSMVATEQITASNVCMRLGQV